MLEGLMVERGMRWMVWVGVATVATVAAAAVGVGWWMWGTAPRGAAVEVAPPEAEGPAVPETLEGLYALEGKAARRVKGPFPKVREALWRSAGGAEGADGGMLVVWEEGKPVAKAAMWGNGGITMDVIVQHLLGYRDMDIEGENRFKFLRMEGDVVVEGGLGRAEQLAALEQVAFEQSGARVMMREVEVEEKAYVLKGRWEYQPIPGLPWGKGGTEPATLPVVELFGGELDEQPAGRRAFSEGTLGGFAGCVSSFVQRNVGVEAEGAPERIRWYYNYRGDGTPESRARAREVEATLRHVCEQTGLRVEEKAMRVKKLQMMEAKGELLP